MITYEALLAARSDAYAAAMAAPTDIPARAAAAKRLLREALDDPTKMPAAERAYHYFCTGVRQAARASRAVARIEDQIQHTNTVLGFVVRDYAAAERPTDLETDQDEDR